VKSNEDVINWVQGGGETNGSDSRSWVATPGWEKVRRLKMEKWVPAYVEKLVPQGKCFHSGVGSQSNRSNETGGRRRGSTQSKLRRNELHDGYGEKEDYN